MSQIELRTVAFFEGAGKVDRERCVLPRVKVISPESANGRHYLPECLKAALSMYEGAKINLDHAGKPTDSRSVLHRFGWLENVTAEADGCVYADLRYNPKHAFAETFAWWAENKPDQIGLSHNAIGTGRQRQDGIFEVTRIVEVRSVDLVADPATVKGLFESQQKQEKPSMTKATAKAILTEKLKPRLSPVKKQRLSLPKLLKELDEEPAFSQAETDEPAPDADPGAAIDTAFEAVVLAILRDKTLDAGAKTKKIGKALKIHEYLTGDDAAGAGEPDFDGSPDGGDDSTGTDDGGGMESKKDKGKAGQSSLTEAEKKELDELRAGKRLAEQRKKAVAACDKARLPETARSEFFLEQLAQQPTEQAMLAMIEDRRKVLGIKTPTSAGQGAGQQTGETKKPADAKEFAESLFKGTGISPRK